MSKNIMPSILYMGTPEFSASILKTILSNGFNVVCVVTRPDTTKGRSGLKSPSEVKTVALLNNLPVYTPNSKEELASIVQKIKPDLIIVAAFGMLVPKEVLDTPKYGALNIHGSILPKYRGASPINEAILMADEETGITIMKMNLGMDEGDIVSIQRTKILPKETASALRKRLSDLGAKTICEIIPDWIDGKIVPIKQDNSLATYCKKITKNDGHINWSEGSAEIERKIRAYDSWPKTFSFIQGKRLSILDGRVRDDISISPGKIIFENKIVLVGTQNGSLEINLLQLEGKKPMSGADFINGFPDLNNEQLI